MAATQHPRLRLFHIRDEINNLSEQLKGATFETYQDSYSLRRTTERAIQIISEAARALPAELRAHHADVPWADIIAIGNPLRHEYHRIDDRVLWQTATAELPALHAAVLQMLLEFE